MATKLKEKVIAASRSKHLNQIGIGFFIVCAIILLISKDSGFKNIIHNLILILGILALLAWRTLFGLSKTPMDVLKNNNLIYVAFSIPNVVEWYMIWIVFFPMFLYMEPNLEFNFAGSLFLITLIVLFTIASIQISRYFKSKLVKDEE